MVLEHLLFGALGGVARSLVGILKSIRKKEKIVWQYATITILASAIIGAAVGLVFDTSAKVSLISAYVGMDIGEGTYRIVRKL
jgi:fluoride ion exporter CrcB/FEX